MIANVATAQHTQGIGRLKAVVPGAPPIRRLPPASIDDSLSIGGDDIKARKVDTRLTVQVQINGRGPYRFLVDSGADTSVVGLEIARTLNLPLGTPATLIGMTDRNIVDRVQVDSLTLGPSTTRNLELPFLREDDLGAQGIIGIDALARQRLMLDFDKRLIKIEDAMKPPKPLPGEIVVTARRRRGQLILTHVLAGGLSVDAVIDTGAEISIGNLRLRDTYLRSGKKLDIIAATGVTGKTVDLQVAVIPELRIGKLVVRDLPIAFADLPPFEMFGLSDQPALLLGTDVLETFRRVSLDFQSRKVRFQPRRCPFRSVVVDRSLSRPPC
jgi:predicted aspartyl protease